MVQRVRCASVRQRVAANPNPHSLTPSQPSGSCRSGWAVGHRWQHANAIPTHAVCAESHAAAARLRVLVDQAREAQQLLSHNKADLWVLVRQVRQRKEAQHHIVAAAGQAQAVAAPRNAADRVSVVLQGPTVHGPIGLGMGCVVCCAQHTHARLWSRPGDAAAAPGGRRLVVVLRAVKETRVGSILTGGRRGCRPRPHLKGGDE
jgi:hypothetical protein